MANTLMSLLVSIGVDTADFQKGIGGAEKSALSFAGKMTQIGDKMKKIGGAMTVGLTLPIVAFGASSVQSAMDAESAMADLEAVLKSTGGVAGVTLDELTKNAAALQDITKFSDEAVMSAQGMLLTFTNIGKDVFPDATMAALDMAEKFGMDASQAAITLGKALNDPVAGVTALRRIGVMLTDEQQKQIESFMAVGDIASAQAIIMNELAVEIGGVAEAAGATTQGQFEQFKNKLDDMKETIGVALIPTLIRLMEAITPLIEKFSSATPAQQNFVLALAGIAAAAGPVVTVIGGITSAVGTLTPIITGLFTFITATAIPAIGAFIIANAAWIVPLLLVAATVYLVYKAFETNFGGIRTTVEQLWFIIKYVFNNIITKISEVIAKVMDMAKSFLGIKAPNLGTGVPSGGKKAFGGSVLANREYTVGEHGTEKFIPATNGRIIPNGEITGSGTKNITINVMNPKAITTEESVRRELMKLSYLGVAT